jgi:hypothetical protein
MTLPQVRGMYEGDFSRKTTLVDYGFRLPSALDNRPLRFPEFEQKIKQAVASPDGVKPLADVLVDLAGKVGISIPAGTPEEIYTALAAEVPVFAEVSYEQITKPEGVYLREA